MSFPKGSRRQCPVEGCPGVSETRAAMRAHFVHWHVHDTVVILEEANLPLPRCPWCDLQVSRKALNGRHLGTNPCRTGAERKIRRLAAAEGEAATERAFNAYRRRVKLVKGFRYLGRILTSTDDDWPAVARNLQKARARWGRLARIMGREGADPKLSRNFYIAVTQQVLLFGAETWVLTKNMEAALEGVQGRFRLPRQYPGLRPEEEDLLCHGNIEIA